MFKVAIPEINTDEKVVLNANSRRYKTTDLVDHSLLSNAQILFKTKLKKVEMETAATLATASERKPDKR
nr:hypothetical protein [Collinsella sp. BIOML-A5]